MMNDERGMMNNECGMLKAYRLPAKVTLRLRRLMFGKALPCLVAAPCLVALTVLIGSLNVVSVVAQERRATTTRAREVKAATSAMPAAEATITLNEALFNSFLDALFKNLKAPSFPLSLARREAEKGLKPEVGSLRDSSLMTKTRDSSATAASADDALNAHECASVVVLEREMDNVKTAVHFESGRIVAPLAFTGSYNAGLLGCVRFQGWADTALNLEFARARQVLIARVQVRDMHLKGVPQMANNVVVGLVQDAIDRRLNPIENLQAAQLSARVPIAASGGALRLLAKEVRPEIVQGALHLHIIYEFVPMN